MLVCSAGIPNPEAAAKAETALEAQAQHLQQEEEEEARQQGHVKARVYHKYGRAAGWILVVVMAVSFILMQVMFTTRLLCSSLWNSNSCLTGMCLAAIEATCLALRTLTSQHASKGSTQLIQVQCFWLT